MTVFGLPDSYVTHDSQNQQFELSQTSDVSFIGTYEVTIESSFSQSDYQGESSTVTASTTFSITVAACSVESLEVAQAIDSQVTYKLGDTGQSIGPYAFIQ